MKTQTKTQMKAQVRTMAGAMAALLVGAAGASAFAMEPDATGTVGSGQHAAANDSLVANEGLVRDAQATVASFRQTDPGLSRFFTSAVGFVAFPTVGKGAAGIGGAYGRGVLFEHGKPTGQASLTQVTIGAQLGGQAYSEIVFFENKEALASFKKGELAMAAQVSAVAASAGASANARYARGVAVFTLAKSGLMAEASVGGQKFGFRPFAKTM